MARPESYDDLDRYEREGRSILSADLTELNKLEIFEAIAGAYRIAASLRAAHDGFDSAVPYGQLIEVQNTGNRLEVLRNLNSEELDDRLANSQRLWDYGREVYEAAKNLEPLPHYRFYVNDYIRAEGLEPIDWEDYDRLRTEAQQTMDTSDEVEPSEEQER